MLIGQGRRAFFQAFFRAFSRTVPLSLIFPPVLTPALALCTALAVIALSGAAWSTPVHAAETLVVSAAASLGDALNALKEAFEAKHEGWRLELNLGSSGALHQQIRHGAPVDVFLSAAEAPVQALVDLGLVDGDQVKVFATNRLVLIGGPHAPSRLRAWEDLLRNDVQRVAMGNPEHVPAGHYGRTVLENLDLWEPLQHKLVFGEDVRQVLAYVESGAADVGLVYGTDAAAAQQIHVVAPAPAGSHPPIRYPAAVVRTSRAPQQARGFLAFLLSEEGQAILRRYGFHGPEDEA